MPTRMQISWAMLWISVWTNAANGWLITFTKSINVRSSERANANIQLAAGTPKNNGRETRSFVEGDVFEDPVDEIEALGGDVFFLETEHSDSSISKGQDHDDYLWDGVEDDNAHLDLDLD